MPRKITSNGGKNHLDLCLSGDLPLDQGAPNSSEIRLVKLTFDYGMIGTDDACEIRRVMFDVAGRPVHIQECVLAVTTTMIGTDAKILMEMYQQLSAWLEALGKPIIDLRT